MTKQKIVMELAKMLMPCYRGYCCMLQTKKTDKTSKYHREPGKARTAIMPESKQKRKLDFGKLRKEIAHIVNDYAESKPRQMPYKLRSMNILLSDFYTCTMFTSI